jgi:predicted aspartyl protease
MPAGTALIPVRFIQNSIVVPVTVNGHTLDMVLDTGDTIGPTFTSADAQALGLAQGPAEGIEGAGGASDVYETTATIQLGSLVFPSEVGAVDSSLEGWSLIGFPFFQSRCSLFELDLVNGYLILIGR